MKGKIKEALKETGAAAIGIARAGEVESRVADDYERWIEEGSHGEMQYLERHIPLRRTTDSVLPGARSIICLAYSFAPDEWRPEHFPYISAYAYGEDYHTSLRKILKPVVNELKKEYGGLWRICIDSAPVSERYWALKSGIGRRGRNGAVIIEGCGALNFLVEILTTLELEADLPSEEICMNCGKCISICPGGALKGDGTMDARKCINYITIEKKGELSENEQDLIKTGSGYLYGCDRCLRVCPHNRLSFPTDPSFPGRLKDFDPFPDILTQAFPESLKNRKR